MKTVFFFFFTLLVFRREFIGFLFFNLWLTTLIPEVRDLLLKTAFSGEMQCPLSVPLNSHQTRQRTASDILQGPSCLDDHQGANRASWELFDTFPSGKFPSLSLCPLPGQIYVKIDVLVISKLNVTHLCWFTSKQVQSQASLWFSSEKIALSAYIKQFSLPVLESAYTY